MSQLKILKQDVINAFQSNITEGNIDDITNELKKITQQELKIEISNNNYMCFGSNIIIPHMTYKIAGFGRTEFDALKTSIINLIDQLLQEERYVNPIKDSLRICSNDNRSRSKVRKERFKSQSHSPTASPSISPSPLPFSPIIATKEIAFEIFGSSISYKEIIKEKDLILKEMENLVIDIMTYNKKITEYFEQMTNPENIPKYYKCPISWELMENPVVSEEGHSYEKWAIDKWLYTQNKSPITGLEFDNGRMIHNYTLKYAIDDFCLRQVNMKKMKIELQKFLMKCEYDLTDLKKYFKTPPL